MLGSRCQLVARSGACLAALVLLALGAACIRGPAAPASSTAPTAAATTRVRVAVQGRLDVAHMGIGIHVAEGIENALVG